MPSSSAPRLAPRFDIAPYRLSGAVYVTLLNHRRSFEALGDAISAPPYRGAPKAVVLAIKPRHALVGEGETLLVDEGTPELAIAASLGIVIGRAACAVAERDALAHVAGYLVVADATVPHASHYRPQIRAMARDASCALGAAVVARDRVGDADALEVRTYVDGALATTTSTAAHVRTVARLIAEISDFMTLAPGDVLLAGSAPDAPRVRAGARIAVEIERVGRLETRVVAAERSAA
ncbi:MAG TPA: fumarylacetoacetate hydrolase family protein [Caldimonas sp.]|jgi:5-oxopent-3-ene-1,2,5-tricarboxylate decarboxylase/2-hydroxyhepta-2,4-diene-1,7-dioate isomerase